MTARGLLRYPGGKARGMDKILPFLADEKVVVSPFFGGGVIEFALARQGTRVYGYDAMKPLVNFWQWVKKDKESLSEYVEGIGVMSKDGRRCHVKKLRESDCESLVDAGVFYAINRVTFSGSMDGGYSEYAAMRGSPEQYKWNILHFDFPQTLTIGYEDFEATLEKHPHEFLYCDPPYLGVRERLYGFDGGLHKDFKHGALRDSLMKRDKWVLSYGDCEEVRELYKGKRMIEMSWKYSSNGSDGRELLIFGDAINANSDIPIFDLKEGEE